MTRSPDPATLESRLLELIRDAGLSPPDEICRDNPAEVLLLWHDRKLAVVLELDDEEDADDDAERAAP